MTRLWIRWAAMAGLVLLIAALATSAYAQGGHGEDDENDDSGSEEADAHTDEYAAVRGAAVYATYCQACHGPEGAALASGPAFAVIAYDAETARDVVLTGLDNNPDDGLAMPGYEAVLDEAAVDDLLAYMAAWGTEDVPALPEPNVAVEVTDVPDYYGDVLAGAVVYAKSCYGCHGEQGEGHGEDGFRGFEFSPDTMALVAEGHAEGAVPAFAAEQGGPLSTEQLTDLETYMASWQLIEDDDEGDSAEGLSYLLLLTGVVAVIVVGAVYARGYRMGNDDA